MTTQYTHIVDLAKEAEPPDDGILTRTLFNDDDVKAVIFGFGAGQELPEHTASMPAILHFIKGEATLTLGEDSQDAGPESDSEGVGDRERTVRFSASPVLAESRIGGAE